jgi:hypothetical protein
LWEEPPPEERPIMGTITAGHEKKMIKKRNTPFLMM